MDHCVSRLLLVLCGIHVMRHHRHHQDEKGCNVLRGSLLHDACKDLSAIQAVSPQRRTTFAAHIHLQGRGRKLLEPNVSSRMVAKARPRCFRRETHMRQELGDKSTSPLTIRPLVRHKSRRFHRMSFLRRYKPGNRSGKDEVGPQLDQEHSRRLSRHPQHCGIDDSSLLGQTANSDFYCQVFRHPREENSAKAFGFVAPENSDSHMTFSPETTHSRHTYAGEGFRRLEAIMGIGLKFPGRISRNPDVPDNVSRLNPGARSPQPCGVCYTPRPSCGPPHDFLRAVELICFPEEKAMARSESADVCLSKDLLAPVPNCPLYFSELKKVLRSPSIRCINRKHTEAFDYVAEQAGTKEFDLAVYDTLKIQVLNSDVASSGGRLFVPAPAVTHAAACGELLQGKLCFALCYTSIVCYLTHRPLKRSSVFDVTALWFLLRASSVCSTGRLATPHHTPLNTEVAQRSENCEEDIRIVLYYGQPFWSQRPHESSLRSFPAQHQLHKEAAETLVFRPLTRTRVEVVVNFQSAHFIVNSLYHGGYVVRPIPSQQDRPGSIPGGVVKMFACGKCGGRCRGAVGFFGAFPVFSTLAFHPCFPSSPHFNLTGTEDYTRSDQSPPNLANRFRFPAGSLPDFRKWESCRTMPLRDRFPGRISRSGTAPYPHHFTLIGSRDLDTDIRVLGSLLGRPQSRLSQLRGYSRNLEHVLLPFRPCPKTVIPGARPLRGGGGGEAGLYKYTGAETLAENGYENCYGNGVSSGAGLKVRNRSGSAPRSWLESR
ncbi:hypothetical protein PR048_032653 [Dryococelus australis]|uniref:Uncharacterized protein n=1 Tax=Dryococelus australis TaxID=614101 RepID=A0ABQ9G3Z5_9NEOP|nr:hypothetical protein PR048_032653 [Dryococelus australis]